MDLKELEFVDPETHWYYQHKYQSVIHGLERAPITGDTLVDVGAGSGFFGINVGKALGMNSIVCVDPHYREDQISTDSRVSFVRDLGATSGALYLLMDVLEHVDDDLELLREYVRTASQGAIFLITVPAFSWLWSAHDVFLEHRRRYTLKEVRALCEQAPIDVIYARYLFAPTLPMVAMARLLRRKSRPGSDLRTLPTFLNHFLRGLSASELAFGGNRLAGSTAMVVCVKR